MRVSCFNGTLYVLVIILAGALFPSPGIGQTINSPYRYVDTRQEAAILVGPANLATGRFGYGPSGGLLVGGRWGVNLSGPLAFEAVASTLTGERDIVDPSRAEGQRVVGQADVLVGMVDARLVFTLTGNRTWHRLAPFVQAGGGMAFDLAGSDAGDEALLAADRFGFGTSFLGQFGAGSRYFLTDRLVLRGDANFSLYKLDTPPGFSEPDRSFDAVEEGEWVSGLLLSLSVGVRF